MCNAPSQCQLESHQGDGLNQLQEKKNTLFWNRSLIPGPRWFLQKIDGAKLQKTYKKQQNQNHLIIVEYVRTCVNKDYKRISNYHKGTGHNTSYLDLTIKKKKTSSSKTLSWRFTILLQLSKGRGTSIFQCMWESYRQNKWCLCSTKSRKG